MAAIGDLQPEPADRVSPFGVKLAANGSFKEIAFMSLAGQKRPLDS
jgi:hypothetical protein